MTTVVLIDSAFERSSPSARGMVDLVRSLSARASPPFRFEIWAQSVEPSLVESVHFRPFRKRFQNRILALVCLSLEITTRFLQEKLFQRQRERVYLSNGFLCPFADLVTVHFSGWDWFLKTCRLGGKAPQFFSSTLRAALVVCLDTLYQWSPVSNRLVAVSQGVESDLQKFAAPWKETAMIANLQADGVYCPAERERRRARMRPEVIPRDDDETCVLGFCSLGHLRRKGFWLAVEAVAEARRAGAKILFFVIGNDGTDLHEELGQIDPSFEDWIRFQSYPAPVLDCLSACDGYLFPSYSEAFSLTEIEAAALGLRLYFTPHHGVEMFEQETFYGRVLPWKVSEVSQALLSDWQEGKIKPGPVSSNSSLTLQEFERRWVQEIKAMSRRGDSE